MVKIRNERDIIRLFFDIVRITFAFLCVYMAIGMKGQRGTTGWRMNEILKPSIAAEVNHTHTHTQKVISSGTQALRQ